MKKYSQEEYNNLHTEIESALKAYFYNFGSSPESVALSDYYHTRPNVLHNILIEEQTGFTLARAFKIIHWNKLHKDQVELRGKRGTMLRKLRYIK